MGFENSTNMINAKNYHENKGTRFIKKEEASFDRRVANLSKNPKNALKSEGMKAVAKNLMLVQELSSNDLRRMAEEDNEKLEQICVAYDPAVITMLLQYYEVNKKELKLN